MKNLRTPRGLSEAQFESGYPTLFRSELAEPRVKFSAGFWFLLFCGLSMWAGFCLAAAGV